MSAKPVIMDKGVKKRVLVALSGGVDSSVCVHILQSQGYAVAGVVLKMSPAHDQTVALAQQAADRLGIELFVKDMQVPFRTHVIDYFVHAYQNGITPNPCVVCNPAVKFRALLDCADEHGFDLVATGHYAKLEQIGEITYLKRGESLKRDQSYMLYRLQQDVLSRLLLPLASLEKDQVRAIARQIGLACAQAPDSQEICFIPDNDYAGYIETHYGPSAPGDFIAPDGTVCGRHKGVIHYTVGQRKGLGIALGRPVFVTQIDAAANRIYLKDADDAMQTQVQIGQMSYTTPCMLMHPTAVTVKIRSMAQPVAATAIPLEDGSCRVEFQTPQRAPAKGQSVVLYQDDVVLGGGFIL